MTLRETLPEIYYKATLVYYDGVQVFEGRDFSDRIYVGAMIDTVGDADRYLVVNVARESLSHFKAGAKDLRTLLVEGAERRWYTACVRDDFTQPVILEPQEAQVTDSDFLPEPGFYLPPVPYPSPAKSGI